jgi:hypothetical protein
MENERKFDAKEVQECEENEKKFDAGLIFKPRDIIIIKKSIKIKKKKKKKRFWTVWGKTVQNWFRTVWSKPSGIADSFT